MARLTPMKQNQSVRWLISHKPGHGYVVTKIVSSDEVSTDEYKEAERYVAARVRRD